MMRALYGQLSAKTWGAGYLRRSVLVLMLLLSSLSLLAAAYVGSLQATPRFQYPSVTKYANLLIVSGFCWGSLLQGYLLRGTTSVMRRIRNAVVAVSALGVVYVVALPPVILSNTGQVPDTLASWLMTASGAVPGVILSMLLWLLQRLLSAREQKSE